MPNALSYRAQVIGHQESKEVTLSIINIKHINRKTRKKKKRSSLCNITSEKPMDALCKKSHHHQSIYALYALCLVGHPASCSADSVELVRTTDAAYG